MNKLMEAALSYQKQGLSVIPLASRAKVPPKGFSPIPYRDRLATEEEIRQWWNTDPNYNIGIITGKLSDVFVFDLDKHDSAYSEDTALEYFSDNINCPTSSTPKGGQHLYFKSPEENITIGSRFLPGIDYRGEGGYIVAPPSVNGNGKAYSWVVPFDRAMLTLPPQAAINKISTLYKGTTNDNKPSELQTTTTTTSDYKMFIYGTRDSDLFHTANCLVKGGMPENEIRQVLEMLIISWGENPDQKWINLKIQSALDRSERRKKNWTEEIKEFVSTTNGYFSTTDCYKELQATTSDHKKAIIIALMRLKQAGIIEKHGEKNGCYRKIEIEEETIIDLSTADNSCLPIKFPLGIHELVKIMPKNIIIIAGESNAGKSAFLLNTAAKNMINHKVFYFSSEMGGAELKERLQNFNEKMPYEMWKHCTFIERANDFDVAIRPDDINIIDFLEIHDEFYKIGGYIKKIFDKLNKGIAIIAIQKNKGRDDGLGGARSIEKARLYLSMSAGLVKIVKAKNWVSGLMNPNGLQREYKLAKGMIFKADSNWAKAND